MQKTSLCSDVEAGGPIIALFIPDSLLLETFQYVDVPIVGGVIQTVVALPVLAIDLRPWGAHHQVDYV